MIDVIPRRLAWFEGWQISGTKSAFTSLSRQTVTMTSYNDSTINSGICIIRPHHTHTVDAVYCDRCHT